uniref:Uncharacterized protein n=2 Tax=Parascaris univalens TaxID=6257 RepID=A0A914ZY50_PARUN
MRGQSVEEHKSVIDVMDFGITVKMSDRQFEVPLSHLERMQVTLHRKCDFGFIVGVDFRSLFHPSKRSGNEQLRSAEAADYAHHSGGLSERRFASHDGYSTESAFGPNVIRMQQSRHSVGDVSQQGFVHASNIDDVFAPKFAHQCAPERDIVGGSRSSSLRQTSEHKSPLRPDVINYFQRCGEDYPKNSDI